MASVMFPDFLGAIGKASAIEANQAQRDWMDEDRAAKTEIAPLIPKAMQGDREALNRIGTRHPDTLMKIAPFLERADAATRTRAKEAAEWTTKAAMGVLSLPPEQRPAAYQAALADGQRLGYQIDMPPQYDRAVEGRLNQVINQARPIADYFKGRDEGFDLVPSGGGGGAPATGDMLSRTKQVIGGMESSNRYDAVGPDTGGGKKALGKYQVMDFNVGPWTQEALGRALTPEQFLASPQAQEAVADFKLGQYIKQFGSPEAAARAWFAGAGGMNNAGAKDVLGTSVQGYGQKFAQAFGPGATGDAPPGIAQGDTAPPADASGTPIPTSDGGSVPREAMRMITPNLPPGTSLGRDRKTGLFKVQEGNFVIYDSNRNPVGLIPIPKPKEQGTGPFTGNSVEAQALNMLIANGTLTQPQAADLAAGKTITNPADGSVIFMTPSGLFKQAPGGQPMPAAPGGGAPAPAAPGAGMIPVTPPKPVQMTEGQSNAALYADRMREADAIIAANEKAGMSVGGKALEVLPGGVGNFLQSDAYQLFEQARRNFINAVLRRESGAVIADTEFANAEKQYFPRPGDSEAVLKQKAANRRSAIEGIARAAGPAYKPQAAPTPAAAPTTAPAPQAPGGADRGKLLFDARDAIAKGADPAKVRERLRSLGIEDEP
jgi:hypothetical protein